MNLKNEWLGEASQLSRNRASLWCGGRKIHTDVTVRLPALDDSLQMRDAGYTQSKLTMLRNHYLHHESRDVAIQLWDKRRSMAKYGSVGFTTYGHFVKGGDVDSKRSRIASVFGPCIQSVCITWIDKQFYTINIFYRTTEFFKKFPADLVLLRNVLLEGFNFDHMRCSNVIAHFANVTMHPMYWVVTAAHMSDPVHELERIRKADPIFWRWCVKWTARYMLAEHFKAIAKFSQALRVKITADTLKGAPRRELQAYVRKHMRALGKSVKIEEDENDE